MAAAAAIGPSRAVADGVDTETAASPPVAAAAPADPPTAAGPEGSPADDADAGEASSAVTTADPDHAQPVAPAEHAAEEPDGSAVVDAPPIAPAVVEADAPSIEADAADPGGAGAGPTADIESVAARRPRSGPRRGGRWALSRLNAGIVALMLVDAFLLGWRSDVVWALPQTASFYALIGLPVNLRGLAFERVTTLTEQHEGVAILVVTGNIVNVSRAMVNVPRLKFIVRNAVRQEIYSWTAAPARRMLSPGESIAFRSRLASPPPEAHDIVLRFVNRRDLIAEAR